MRFQSDRLTEAREARDLTMTALGDIVGRKPASISHYENGRHEPPPEVVKSLADALNVRVGFFFKQARPQTEEPTFFRSMAATTKRARVRADRRIDWTSDVLDFVESHLKIQPANLPEGPEANWKNLTPEAIEAEATRLRRFWDLGDGPIPNLVWLVEQHGIVVVRDAIGDRHLDAHSRWCGSRPIVVLNSDKKSAVRSRFDCAHELGHLVLHGGASRSDVQRTENRKRIEGQADLFAGAFLLPTESFSAEVGHPSLESLLALKPRWKVSLGAMVRRCQRLGIISKTDANRLWRSRSRRGWNKREPYDDSILPEQPRMLARAFELILANNLASRDAVLHATELESSDIAGLAGLSDDFFTASGRKIIPLRSVQLSV